jgi:hypothetical protein
MSREVPGIEGGWVGFDLDRTLAHYTEWLGIGNIGAPVPAMAAHVKAWIAEGRDVRIFTARISIPEDTSKRAERELEAAVNLAAVRLWCFKHLGKVLPVTCVKDYKCDAIYDDIAVQIVPNEGRRADGLPL